MMQSIIAALREIRLPPLAREAQLGDAVAERLSAHNIPFQREKTIGQGCRVDFFCDGIVLELKLAAKKSTTAQITRYLQCEGVAGLILVAERTVNISAVARKSGKPALCFSVRRAWGVAV